MVWTFSLISKYCARLNSCLLNIAIIKLLIQYFFLLTSFRKSFHVGESAETGNSCSRIWLTAMTRKAQVSRVQQNVQEMLTSGLYIKKLTPYFTSYVLCHAIKRLVIKWKFNSRVKVLQNSARFNAAAAYVCAFGNSLIIDFFHVFFSSVRSWVFVLVLRPKFEVKVSVSYQWFCVLVSYGFEVFQDLSKCLRI